MERKGSLKTACGEEERMYTEEETWLGERNAGEMIHKDEDSKLGKGRLDGENSLREER